HPAIACEEDVVVLRDDELLLGEGPLLAHRLDDRPALAELAEARAEPLELPADEPPDPAAPFLVQELLDLAGALLLLLELVLDDEDLEAREAVETKLEDRVGLLVVELEPRHDLLRGVRLPVGGADDLDDLIERVEDRREALEDVHPLGERRELVLEA